MGRAIDIDKLCTDLMERWDIADKRKEELVKQVMADIVTPIVVSQPTIETEIVRCKDCRYMTEHYDTDGNVPYWTCSEWDSGTDYNGFCHYAERRTDETN